MTENTRSPLAVITGGGTGLGFATGLELQARGYRVLALGLDRESDLERSGIAFEPLDVTDAAAVQAVAAREPQVRVLVNAAGTLLREGREFTIEGFRQVVDINLNGTQLACLSFRDALQRGRGSVINFASMWSYFGSARNPAYSASKGAIVQLTKSLAVSYAPQGIRVNAVAPGWIATAMAAPVLHDEERSAALLARLPVGRFGEPADVAKAVAFLASEDAGYITGVTLPVDGGYSIA